MRGVLAFALALLSGAAHAGLFGPSNYEECVLDSMKGVTSDVAARAIMRSCQEKFPVKRPSDTLVPAHVINQLDGRAGMRYGFFEGNIYNGNRDWTITQVTIALETKAKNKSPVSKPHLREYNVDVNVAPLTTERFIFSAKSEGSEELDWYIVRARGYQSR